MLLDPGYKFCPKCGAALSRRRLKDFEPERLVCTQCKFVMYLNPKVAAGAVVQYEGGIVLLRREIDPRAGFWVHPGGFVDRGETLEAAARRETREEVGLDVEIGRLLGVYSFPDSEVVVVTYAAHVLAGSPTVGDESLEVRTFLPHELPWDDLAFPSTQQALRDYLRTMDGEGGLAPRDSRDMASDLEGGRSPRHERVSILGEDPATVAGRLETLLQARTEAFLANDARAASLVYPSLIGILCNARRFREALTFAEEGLALTHDPMIARLADEIADDLAESERERC